MINKQSIRRSTNSSDNKNPSEESSNPFRDPAKNPWRTQREEEKPNSYYRDKSREAIETALKESEGMSLADRRSAIRRNYPFGDGDRKGRSYKQWNSMCLEYEARLGFPKQRKTTQKKTVVKTNLTY
jgi:hypothetical protein